MLRGKLMDDKVSNRNRYTRYGQEEIEQLLLSCGAREIVDIPRRELLPGEEDPPWVRKSSRR